MKRYIPKKTKAFTLIEVLIVLTITSIVITLAMWSYVNVSKYLKSYNENETQNQEMALFLKHFSFDFNDAYTIEEEYYLLEMNFETDASVTYDFYDDIIIRYYRNYPDTFYIGIASFDYIAHDYNKSWIQELKLTLSATGVEYPIRFYKSYSNQQLFHAYEY